ncbi:tetratricopeptide repeat protein [Sphingomonas sp. GB1N7]
MPIALQSASVCDDTAVQTQKLQAVEVFALADRALREDRSAEAEALYLALTRDPDLEIRTEARFRLGMILAGQKRYRDAALVFRKLLDEKPGAARVRLELARALTLMGDPDGARRQLRQAQSAGLPQDVATVVDQFANALRSTKHFGGSIELALAPDSNINRATSAKTLDTVIAPLTLDRDARERSGLGVKLGGQGYVRQALGSTISMLGRVSASANLYQQGRFNDVSVSLAAGPDVTLNTGKDRIQPAAIASNRYYGGALYAQTLGGTVNWTHAVGRRGQIQVDLSGAQSRYALNDLQSGALYNGALTVERAFTPRFGASLTLSADRQSANNPGYATRSGGGSALLWRDLGRATIYGTLSYRHLGSDERLFLYLRSRTDDFARIGIGASFRKLSLAGLAPVMRLAYEHNRSTVGIYDYRRASVEFGVTRAF